MTTIGPISLRDWRAMSLLYKSIRKFKEKEDPKYLEAYKLESSLYKGLRSKYEPGSWS